MPKKGPTVPVPLPRGLKSRLVKRMMVVGGTIDKGFPGLRIDLYQAGIEMDPREYATIAVITAIFYGVFAVILISVAGLVLNIDLRFPAIFLGFLFLLFTFVSFLAYPRIYARRRMRELEINLVPCLRHILIEIRSGVSLFYAMVAVSEGYGETSRQFRKIVMDINTGVKETDALAEATKINPSFSFRRALWQMSNALKAGSDLGIAIGAIVDDLRAEQLTAIRKYGQELNPWTMLYMVGAVIVPSLGITFFAILTSFTVAVIPKIIFPLIIVALIGFELFFMNFVKSKRPAI